MIFRNPGALAGMLLIALPVLVHLLSRSRAPRITFPSLRFVPASALHSARRRVVSEWPLLLVRVAIVAAAVFALADPVVVTPARRAAWEARTTRAFVVDATSSMREPAAAEAVRTEVDRLSSASYRFARVDAGSLDRGVGSALAWLDEAPPSRRELVVVSDFQADSFDPAFLRSVPAAIGVRLVRAGELPAVREVRERNLTVEGDRLVAREVSARLTRDATLLLPGAAEAALPPSLSVIAPAGDMPFARAALEAALRRGAPAEAPPGLIVLQFAGAAAGGDDPPDDPWMVPFVAAVANEPRLGPEVSFAQAGGGLLVRTAFRATDPRAALSAQMLLDAARDPASRIEREVRSLTDADLRALSRDAPAPGPELARRADDADRRVFWAAALVLLGLEVLFRRARGAAAGTEAHAA